MSEFSLLSFAEWLTLAIFLPSLLVFIYSAMKYSKYKKRIKNYDSLGLTCKKCLHYHPTYEKHIFHCTIHDTHFSKIHEDENYKLLCPHYKKDELQ